MKTTFYHITDIHYMSKKNWRGNNHYELPRMVDQISFRETEEILKRTVDYILADETTDIVLVTGDITATGDKDSHEEAVSKLRRLKDNGKKVYAYIASHDFPNGKSAFYFDENGNRVKDYGLGAPIEEANEYYAKFGYNEALAKLERNHSYVLDLSEAIRYLAIAVDYVTKRNRHPEILKESREFIRKELDRAKNEGKIVVASCHHPLLAPSPIYKVIGGHHDMLGDAESIIDLLIDGGVQIVLTGHSHINDVEYVNRKEKTFYDISTAAISGFPPVMRKIIIDSTAKTVAIDTITLDSLDGPILVPNLENYCREGFIGFVEKLIKAMGDNISEFKTMAGSMSIKPEQIASVAPFIKLFGKFINGLTFGIVGNITRKESGLKKNDYRA